MQNKIGSPNGSEELTPRNAESIVLGPVLDRAANLASIDTGRAGTPAVAKIGPEKRELHLAA